jgi:hypothetical protein
LKVTNTSSLVEELQEGGRATRTDPNNPSKVANVVNFPLYINGKLQGNPCFYFEAIGKPEFVKGVVDVNVDFDRLLQHSLDDGTKRELKQALDEEAKKQPHADKNERRPKYKEGENTRKDAAHQGKLIEIKVPENSVVKSGTENGNGNGVRYTYKTELEKVQHIIAQRDGTLLPIKQAEWLSINEMASRLGISGDRKDIKLLYNILSAHYDEYQRHDGQELLVSVTLAGKETTLRLCRQKPSGASPTVFVVHESAESDFRQALPGQLMPLPEDWLFGARGIAEAMGTSHMGEKFKQALTNLQKAVREGQSVEVGDAPIQAQFGYRNEQTVTFGIAPESLESFSKYSGIPLLEPLPDDWIKGRGAIANAIAKISKVTADDVALNNGITALYQKLHEGEELPEAVRASLRLGRSNNIRTFGIAPNAVENIAALLGIEVIGKIPDHYVAGKNPIAQAMGISPGGKAYGERYDALVKELEAGNPIIVDGITLNITRAIDGRTQMNTGVALEHIPLLAKHMGIPMKAVPTEIQNPVGEEVSPKNRTRFK